MDEARVPMVVAELSQFAKDADRILGETQHAGLIAFLGLNPEAGVIVPGTGGVRKLRWALPGRGKRGGARVIYYFQNEDMPLLALDIYAKNEAEDLTSDQKKRFRQIVESVFKKSRR
jgi:hypothetical protein